MSASGLASAGTQVTRALGTSQVFLDDPAFPQLSLAHTAPAGTITLSAGANPGAQFAVQPQAAGNSQILTGPNALISNVFQNPGTAYLGVTNVANSLTVTGPTLLTGNVGITGNTVLTGNVNIAGNTSITGNFLATGSSTFGNVLNVGGSINTPVVTANAITATGPLANLYVETRSSLASTTAAVYLSPNWRLKEVSSGGLAQQYKLNGNWVNASVLAPPGLVITIAGLTTPTT